MSASSIGSLLIAAGITIIAKYILDYLGVPPPIDWLIAGLSYFLVGDRFFGSRF